MYVLKCDASGEDCQMLVRGGSGRVSVREPSLASLTESTSDFFQKAMNTASGGCETKVEALRDHDCSQVRDDVDLMFTDISAAWERGSADGGKPQWSETQIDKDALKERRNALACALFDNKYFKLDYEKIREEDDSVSRSEACEMASSRYTGWTYFKKEMANAYADNTNSEIDMDIVNKMFEQAGWENQEAGAFRKNLSLVQQAEAAGPAEPAEPAAANGAAGTAANAAADKAEVAGTPSPAAL